MSSMARKCFVEGNVGVGKSTLLDTLRGRGFLVVSERVAEFTDELAAFYEEPCPERAMRLQTRIATLCKESACPSTNPPMGLPLMSAYDNGQAVVQDRPELLCV